MEGKQKTPSVIARLMGLDEPAAPQQPRKQRVLSDDYLHKTAFIGLLEKRSLRDVHLSKISPERMHKNFHVSEISETDKQIIPSVSDENSNPSMKRSDSSFSRQTDSHAKYLSEDKKLFHFKGLDDMAGDVQANNSLKYYHHPDLSIKHFGDLKGLQSEQRSGWFLASTSTSISDDSGSEVCKKLDKMNSHRISLRSDQKLYHRSRQTHIDPLENLNPKLDLKDRSTHSCKRIVVLKPNSRRAQNSEKNLLIAKSTTLPLSDSDYMDHKEILKSDNGKMNIERPETAYPNSGLKPPRHSFGINRAAAKQTQVEKTNTGSNFGGFSRSSIAAEKSSPNLSKIISSQSSFDCKRRDRISYPFPSRSLFSVEAKKKIFDRWKSIKSCQEVEVDGRRRTLVEMFVMHDGGVRPNRSSVKISQFSHVGKKLELGSPQCVGNKYSSKYTHIRNQSRLEFLWRSSTADGNSIGDAFQNGLCHYDTGTEDRNNLRNNISQRKNSLEPWDPRSSLKEKRYGAHNAALKINNNIDRETEAEAVVSSVDELPEIGHSILPPGDCRTHTSSDVWENLIPQRSSFDSPGGEPGSSCTSDQDMSINLKEISQHSPISVLEPLFKEENPFASEFYNNPLSDLSGLAMRLELLNTKSEETNSECSGMNVSSDEDNDQESSTVVVPKYDKKLWEMSRPQESRDFSYLVDVLDEANLCDRNLDNLYETWLSTEYPVDPSLFEALEKKYGKQASWLKSDRRFLFDRINSGLKEIMDSFMDIQISGKPLRRRFHPTLRRDGIEEELWILLFDHENEVNKDLSEKALGREMKWSELGDEISIISREIEEALFNELVAELD